MVDIQATFEGRGGREGRIQRLVSMTCTPAAFFHYCSGIIINMAVIISTIVITARYNRHAYTVNIHIRRHRLDKSK